MKRVFVSILIDNKSTHQRYRGYLVNRYFAAVKQQGRRGWDLVHCASGLATWYANPKRQRDVVALGRAAVQKFGEALLIRDPVELASVLRQAGSVKWANAWWKALAVAKAEGGP